MECPNCKPKPLTKNSKGYSHYYRCDNGCNGLFIYKQDLSSHYKTRKISVLKFDSYFTPAVCPQCKNIAMKKYTYSQYFDTKHKDLITKDNLDFCFLDECPECNGIWIDQGDTWFLEKYGSNIIDLQLSGEQRPGSGRHSCTWGLIKTFNSST